MKKTFRLVSVTLWAVLNDMLVIGKLGRKRKAMYAGVVLFTLLMSVLSFFYNFMMGSGLKMFDSLDILPAIIVSAASFVILMTTIFKIKGTVFGFKDYELLMSLPVSTTAVVASRLIILYCFNFLFTIILILPMTIAYGILARPGFGFYIMSLVLMFAVPLIPLITASVLGTVIAYILSKFRRNNLLNIIFSISLMLIIIALTFAFRGDEQELVNMSKAITQQVYGLYPLARLYTNAVINSDVLAFFLFLCISVSAFILYALIVKRLFKKINTLLMTGQTRANFKLGKIKTGSPLKALYSKEIKRYISSSVYVLNTGIGIVLLTISTIAGFFVDLEGIMGGELMFSLAKDNAVLYLIIFIMVSCTSMASISIEGKNFWILKTLPVTPMAIFISKIALNLTICLPALLDAVLIGILLKLDFLRIILMFFIAAASALFISQYGLIINLMLPNFSWTAEVAVIKQSAASVVTIFSSFIFFAVFFIFKFVIPTGAGAYLGYLLFMLIVDMILYCILKSYGVKRFYSL